LVYLLKALDSYGYFALSEVFTTYFSEFGVTDVTAGAYYGVWGTLITVYGILTGFAIDAIGVKRSLVTCYVLQTFSRIVLAFTSDRTTAAVTFFTAQSFASSWGVPVMTIAIKRLVSNEDRVVSFGLFYSVMNVSALLSGVAIDFLRLAVPRTFFENRLRVASPIRGVVLSTVVSSALALIVATRFEDPPEAPPRPRATADRETPPARKTPFEALAASSSDLKKTIARLFESRTFRQFSLMGVFTVNLKQVFRHLDATFPKYAVRAFGCSSPFGLIYAVNPAMIIVGVPLVAAATAKKKHFDMIFAGAWVTAVAPFFLALFQNYFGALSFVIVLSIGEMAWSPRWYDYTMACAPEGKEGVFAALALAPLFLAKLPTGVLGGFLLQRFCPGSGGEKNGDCAGGEVAGGDDGGGASSRASSVTGNPNACDGFAVWGVIGVVTATSPALIAMFHGFLKDSGTDSNGGATYRELVVDADDASGRARESVSDDPVRSDSEEEIERARG
jgi:MFS family permease